MTPFRHNYRDNSFSFLQKIISQTSQSRTLLFLGQSGWGKVACGLDLAQWILKTDPLMSSDFFYFRNDLCALKTEFFLTKKPNTPESWTWLHLLQRRMNTIALIDEHITLPTGIKLPALKEQLAEYLTMGHFPQDQKFITQLITFSQTLTKKTGIPINVVREAISFHSIHTEGRVSLIADFDTADPPTQNAILKLIEEPHPHHWIILTAQTEKTILPTVLSRTLIIPFKKPLPSDFSFLEEHEHLGLTSSIDIMKESLYQLSKVKLNLIQDFFTQCAPQIERSPRFLLWSEEISKENHTLIFLEELIKCFEDALRLRQSAIRKLPIPLSHPQYQKYSAQLSKVSTAELEELVLEIENFQRQIIRAVIKDDYVLPNLLLNIARTLRKAN